MHLHQGGNSSFVTEMLLHSICAAMFLLLLIIPTLSQTTQNLTCWRGWFGSDCQYKCHCRNSRSCDANGACPDGFCERGWFGPGCQYVDLVITNSNSNTPSWLSDDDNNTCNPTSTSQTINVDLNSSFPFSWLRLQVKDPSLLQEFQVMFSPSSSQDNVGCEKMRTAMVSDRTLDIHCELNVTVQNVILIGEGVKSLCSLYISGGRNVALHQKTNQSSTYADPIFGNRTYMAEAKNAVDGNRNQEYFGGSCTVTCASDKNPTWNVSLSQPQIITRYVLYNRNSNMEQLKGFTLESFTENHMMAFDHKDVETVALYIYTITDIETNKPITKVSIQAHNTENLLLTFCEVELYGDSACPPSKYGRECKQTCNCAVKSDPCFVSTGGCPSGCSVGFQGEGCNQPCDPGKFGKGCSSNCSQFCITSRSSGTSCNPTDGACYFGCQTGYQEPRCDQLIMDSDISPVGIALIVTAAMVFVIAVVVVSIICFRRHKHQTHCNKPSVQINSDNICEYEIQFNSGANEYTTQINNHGCKTQIDKEYKTQVNTSDINEYGNIKEGIYCNTLSI